MTYIKGKQLFIEDLDIVTLNVQEQINTIGSIVSQGDSSSITGSFQGILTGSLHGGSDTSISSSHAIIAETALSASHLNADYVIALNGRSGSVSPDPNDYAPYYPSLSGSYSNPAWISSIDASKITQTTSSRFVTDTDKSNWNGKYTLPSGSSTQYVRGDGLLDIFPSILVVETVANYATMISSSRVDRRFINVLSDEVDNPSSPTETLYFYGSTGLRQQILLY